VYKRQEWAGIVAEQAGRLTHASNLYTNPPMLALAERLVASSFADKVFFCNSGAEANETALKIARKAARDRGEGPQVERTRFVAFGCAFHGRTTGALSITFNPAFREPFGPLLPNVNFAPFNDVRSAWTLIDDSVCAVIVEPVQGEGGVRTAEPEFLRALREACDQTGALLIFDEVQCGFGRSGRLWAYEHYGIRPDILTIAKPLAGGLPIGATLVGHAASRALNHGDHGSTFGGGALVCRAACHIFDRLTEPGFLERVAETGAYLRERLAELEHPLIDDIRGLGLLVGLHLEAPAALVVEAARARGLLVLTAGRQVLRLAPPLIAERDHVDRAVDILSACLDEVHEGLLEA
jgi:predicted acetylornithine/succinylornithine family transaminase